MFFGTMAHFIEQFDVTGDPDTITIDFSHSHVWDHSAITAITKVMEKYKQADKKVKIIGLNDDSRKLVEKVGLTSAGLSN